MATPIVPNPESSALLAQRLKEMERDDAIRTLVSHVERLEPGQKLTIVAHNPAEEPDGRHFTVSLEDPSS